MSWGSLSQWVTSLPASLQLGLWFVVGSYTVGLALVFAVIIWLPEDYLQRESRWYRDVRRASPWLYWPVALLKNVLGLVLVAAGVVMLFLPGQGLLTLLLGTLLVDFPGKHVLILKWLTRPVVLKSLNRVRRWAGRPSLRMPAAPQEQSQK